MDNNVKLETNRLYIYPLSLDEMRAVVEQERDDELKQAYLEMLNNCIKHPEQYVWHCIWQVELRATAEAVGDLSFKGLNADGMIEIGYGMKPEYQNQGYMTEAVHAMINWAKKQDGVIRIEAETEPDNMISQRVLAKCGFVSMGVMGEEGPRFVYTK